MKKKIIIFALSLFAMISTVSPVYAEPENQNPKAKWVYDTTGWWYDNGDGTWPHDTFKEIDGVTYYFNSSGYMATGWASVNGSWYFFNPSGAMQKGWIFTGNVWYYLDGTGKMQTGWYLENKTQYYLDASGAMVKGWKKIDNKWYFFNDSGVMQTGWKLDGQTWYYLNDKGVMLTGWQKIGNTWYYMNGSGAMLTGWQKIDGTWYYLDSGGGRKTGWLKQGSTWYYLDENGKMKTGWVKDGNTWYYMKSSGAMATGWLQDPNSWYWYYLDPNSGAMKTGWQTIGGHSYHFEETNGYWDEPEGNPKFYNPESMLIVANKKHKLPDGYVPSGLVIPNVQRTGSNVYMKSQAASALEKMFAGAKTEGITLVMGSGYRSEATQRAIYNGYVARDGQAAADRFSARPGYSEHQTGLAIDISDASGAHYLYESFESTAEGKWLFNNAHKYGFILRYPKGKESITGYMYEPWHYRYVGVEEAGKIYASGKTFEEYYGIAGGGY